MDNSFEQGKTKGSERRWEVVPKMQGRDGSMGVMKRRGEFRVIATMHAEWVAAVGVCVSESSQHMF